MITKCRPIWCVTRACDIQCVWHKCSRKPNLNYMSILWQAWVKHICQPTGPISKPFFNKGQCFWHSGKSIWMSEPSRVHCSKCCYSCTLDIKNLNHYIYRYMYEPNKFLSKLVMCCILVCTRSNGFECNLTGAQCLLEYMSIPRQECVKYMCQSSWTIIIFTIQRGDTGFYYGAISSWMCRDRPDFIVNNIIWINVFNWKNRALIHYFHK